MLRKLAIAPLALGVLAAATGWLYVVARRRFPARGSRDALPLDELAQHSSAPLLWFVPSGPSPPSCSGSRPAGRGSSG